MKKTILFLIAIWVFAAPLHVHEGGAGPAGPGFCPVSGEETKAGISYVHEGKEYHFCCKGCVSKFKKNPSKYLNAQPAAVPVH